MYHDSVTGLPTLESFLDFANKIWKTSEQNRFAILSVNIESFHKINQHYGYSQGNVFLSLFAQRLIRNNQYILSACRVNTDFFLLLNLSEIHLSQAKDYIFDIFSNFHEYTSNLFYDILLSFQIGVCLLSGSIHSSEEAVHFAEYARKSLLHSSSSSETITVAFYQDALLSEHSCEHRILPLFEDIMTFNHLILYLQPKFDLDTNSVIGAEALVRIMDYNGKLLMPDAFLPVLEKYNLAYELDLLVMESILKLIQHWTNTGITPLPVSMNLSERDFASSDFMNIFQELMEKYSDSLDYLEFEISENSISHNPDYMMQAICTLHQFGCKVGLDGFGKGILSINTLGIPPVDSVKFDSSVLNTSMRNNQNIHVLKRLAEMFEDCQIPVICKGIENELEEAFVKQCGIHYVQGYYYGRPVPLDLFEKKYMIYEFNYI